MFLSPSVDTRVFCKIMLRGFKQIIHLLEKYTKGELREEDIR